MSRGNIAKQPPEDNLVDRLNQRLARLMGKKNRQNPHKNNIPSNSKFMLIIFGMIIFLWFLTGIYYVPNGNYGLILRQGRISKVVKGLQIGLTLPYPFVQVVLLDEETNGMTIGKNSSGQFYSVITSDDQRLNINAEITYRISDPQKFFINYYQDSIDLDQRVSWLAMAIIQDYMLHHQAENIIHSNTIVTENEIRKLSNKILANYGLEFSKFSITSLVNNNARAGNPATVIESSSFTNNPVVTDSAANAKQLPALDTELIKEAHRYQQSKAAETESVVTEFKRLLPQYQANKSTIAELMYYKMLSTIPNESSPESYPLLGLSLAQIKQAGSSYDHKLLLTDKPQQPDDIRMVIRNVNRERIYKDR